MTHRFHPLFGVELVFVKRRRNWSSDRVYLLDGDGRLVSLPTEWTDLASEDPFVVVAAGRAAFRTADLLELAELVDGFAAAAGLPVRVCGQGPGDGPASVQ